MKAKLTFALPKGRIQTEVLPLLKAADIIPEAEFFDEKTRKLAFETNNPNIDLIVIRSFDVATFVAFGGADFGVAGNDVIAECDYEQVISPLDLNIAKCRLSIASLQDAPDYKQLGHVRIASKYPNLTRQYFAKKGIQTECIKLNGAMELAPSRGLAPYIVDLVSSGATLKANGLVEREVMLEISSRLIVNRVSYAVHRQTLQPIVDSIAKAIAEVAV